MLNFITKLITAMIYVVFIVIAYNIAKIVFTVVFFAALTLVTKIRERFTTNKE